MASFIYFAVPEDPQLLAAFGEVGVRHEQMTQILRMTIKSLENLTPEEAILATESDTASTIRRRILKLAEKRLGDGQALLKLQALVAECRHLSEKRNDLLHSVVGKQLDGDVKRRVRGNQWDDMPSVAELKDLSEKMHDVLQRLNQARLDGWLSKALAGKKAKHR